MVQRGSIVIPAHNESAVISRTLSFLAPAVARGDIDVVVVCNGCSDRTADIARTFAKVMVVELSVGSKVLALRAGDAATSIFPRLYLDADIDVPYASIREVFDVLKSGRYLAARPKFSYCLEGASWPVRAYYRARSRLPSLHRALWGAGIYGLSQEGRKRFSEFPEVVADDLFVDTLFDRCEVAIVDCDPAVVRVPQTSGALLAVLGRVYKGQSELGESSWRQTVQDLRRAGESGPLGVLDAIVYVVFALRARVRRQETRWATDHSTRAG